MSKRDPYVHPQLLLGIPDIDSSSREVRVEPSARGSGFRAELRGS